MTKVNQFIDLDEIVELFAQWGGEYYNEIVTQTEHAVQCATLAMSAGATDELVAAALLHDMGHLVDLAEHGPRQEAFDSNLHHEAEGARMLALLLPSSVTAPVALHVAAKRYLCSVDPGYILTLSSAALRSLVLQGGRMSVEERHRFERHPHFRSAVQLRQWDDQSKSIGAEVPEFDFFVPLLHRVALDA